MEHDNYNDDTKPNSKKFISFKHRESLLTQLLATDPNLRMIHDLIALFIFVFLLYKIEVFINEPTKFWEIFDGYMRNSSDLGQVIQIWFIMKMFVLCLHYPLVLFNNFFQYRWLINNFENNNYNSDILCEMYENRQYAGCLYQIILYTMYSCISIFAILFYCTYCILVYDIKLIGSFSLLIEMTRLLMKSHSFFIEKKDLFIEKETLKNLMVNKQHTNMYRSFWALSSRASFRKYIYYMFAPTLLYRDSYPRTKKIRWGRVLNFGLQFILFILLAMYVYQGYLVNLTKTCTESIELNLKLLYQIITPGIIFYWLFFYVFFHLYLNLTAELLRFGDRNFYEDFWNSKSAKVYYRKWNHVVQNWLYVYVFIPVDNRFQNRILTNFAVILISALMHEYIVTIVYLLEKYGLVKNLVSIKLIVTNWSILLAILIIEYNYRTSCPLSEPWKQIILPRFIHHVKI
ncbi:Sterol O-acyltransferase 1 [Dermatophagoides pteronyssinus]|uniref:O-acyltransferase n=1 Tax=Dermatophagoides pteronyssinus TaxID=6956 RepID=A0ABQ8IS29_DERPT|nr:Sterol O-acyltransferase 1 [Dermatophagoides pteronyssinus]